MTNFPTWIPVVALALQRDDGCWLMHRRPAHKHHGGLWEFPGGKVEPYEIPCFSLVREIREELGIGIDPTDLAPAGFADGQGLPSASPIVILLYSCTCWSGIPQSLEGGAIDWFEPAAIMDLAMPPLDRLLAADLFADYLA